jgi:hypothetical protein
MKNIENNWNEILSKVKLETFLMLSLIRSLRAQSAFQSKQEVSKALYSIKIHEAGSNKVEIQLETVGLKTTNIYSSSQINLLLKRKLKMKKG